jgi:hypothetical protein
MNSRALRLPLVIIASWLALDALYTRVAGHEGLLAPFGPVQVGPAVLGLVVLGLRLVISFLWLPWAAWRVVRRAS